MRQRAQRRGLSPRQQGVFRPMVNAAWSVASSHRVALSKRAWYEAELQKVINASSTTNVTIAADDFTRLMSHFATLANDTAWIARLATEDERRVRWVIRGLLRDLSTLEGREVTFAYAAATYSRMNRGVLTLDTAPADFLRPVLQALDSRVRRLLREKGLSRAALHGCTGPETSPK